MSISNMSTITASIERSLENCSLSPHHQQSSSASSNSIGKPDSPENQSYDSTTPEKQSYAPTYLELNSDLPLPYHWEQCLDLKTGEIYFINWKTGMRMNEDPRLMNGGDESEGDVSSYESDEGSSTESFPCYSEQQWSNFNNQESFFYEKMNGEIKNNDDADDNSVLVVAGCKRCFMYYMVPKQHEICPKCCAGHLVHFDQSGNGSA